MTSEDELRGRLGRPALSPHIVPPCPTCGGAHVVGDCHGVAGEPVLLAPGERVQRAGMARRRADRCALPITKNDRELLATIKGAGETWSELLQRMYGRYMLLEKVNCAHQYCRGRCIHCGVDAAPTIAVWLEPDDPEDYEAAASAIEALEGR